MFHVKQEKRTLASANLIYEGLCQCMTQKEFAQITIQDIQIASTVSRSTFYRHFDSLTDVLYWRCNQLFQQMFSDFQLSTADDPYHFTHHLLQYWTTHTQILEQLLQIQRADLFYRCHMDNLPLFQQTATPQHAPRAISGLFYGTAHRHLIRCPHNLAEKRQTRICRRTAQHSQTVYAVYSRKRTHHLNCAPWQIFFTRPFQKLYLPKQKLLQINLLPVTVSLFLYFYLINSYRNVYQMRRHFYFPLLGQAESL